MEKRNVKSPYQEKTRPSEGRRRISFGHVLLDEKDEKRHPRSHQTRTHPTEVGGTGRKNDNGRRKPTSTENLAYEFPCSSRKARGNPRGKRANERRQTPIHGISRKKINQVDHA
jgi:hypothetical protein